VTGTLLAVAAALFAVLFVAGFITSPRDVGAELLARYRSLTRMSTREAEATLARRIPELQERFPGRSPLWCLQWLVTDLERAKR
jgi:hypothetical protein